MRKLAHQGNCLFSISLTFFFVLIIGFSTCKSVYADSELKFAAGNTWQHSNDVQIPNNTSGTRFSLNDLAGDGPWQTARVEAIWNYKNRHSVRLLLAPLEYTESNTFSSTVENSTIAFAGSSFSTNSPISAHYKFNSWRIGYRYQFWESDTWNWWAGATLKIREAEIRLSQDSTSAKDDDLGLVPLLYLATRYQINNRWTFTADMDALAGGPGRAVDFGIGLHYRLIHQWRLGAEYRLLEGGADIDELYNFAWFNAVLFNINYRF